MEKVIIVAMDEENAIGKNGEIPWHYSEDMKHFKEKTMSHPVVMGRKTYLSLPEDYRPLPGRENIVLSRGDTDLGESVKVVNSLSEAYSVAEEYGSKLFIAGGASVYEQTLEDADRMILTRVPGTHDGDTFFPEWKKENWILESSESSGDLKFEYYTRKG